MAMLNKDDFYCKLCGSIEYHKQDAVILVDASKVAQDYYGPGVKDRKTVVQEICDDCGLVYQRR
jgi:hypothetical protein